MAIGPRARDEGATLVSLGLGHGKLAVGARRRLR